jgi:hypothetical protein
MINLYFKQILGTFLISVSLFQMSSFAQNRTIDGIGNNVNNPTWGALGADQLQMGPYGFNDGISAIGGVDRPNPRDISNFIFNQDGLIMDKNRLSDFAWVWGQFIDHDITLVTENGFEQCGFAIPQGDIYFDPNATGTKQMHMSRSTFTSGSGTNISNPRKFPNAITAFVDASNVYGSDIERANWLRTYVQGQLKVSDGNMLPFNTLNGKQDGEIDPNAPEMAMANPYATKWFIAGDVRANENILLASMHTIFVREHNRLCELIAVENPNFNDEELYQKAKKIVGGMIQSIVYNDWLPSLGVNLPAYTGYDETVNPGIMNEFSVAAYRYGHTVISSDIIRLDQHGNTIPEGNINLRDAYFNPQVLLDGGGVDPLFRGMGTHLEQDFDTKIINDLRNFLFGPPGAGGLDLAAMNIQRGRERGLADYNSIRAAFNLTPKADFNEISDDVYLNTVLKNTFKDIDNVDPWVGFLAESHMSNSLFGESVMHIVGQQFLNLRDGDRFYYYNDLSLDEDDIELIESSKLGDIVCRNSNVHHMQDNVFLAEPMVLSSNEIVSASLDYEIYPNPASTYLFINKLNVDNDINEILIYDAIGRLVYQNNNTNNGNKIEIDLDGINKGMATVMIKSENGIAVQKLVIQ